MNLQSASEMREVSNGNFNKLKEDAIKSDDFKGLVKGIEGQAEKGCSEYRYHHSTDKQIVSIFNDVLTENGYAVTKHESGLGLNIKW